MTKLKSALVATFLVASMASFSANAIAATAHNLQTGAGTSNSYDSAESAVMKQAK